MDNLTKEQRRKNMQHICSKDTIPERMVAKELKKRKIYFSQHSKAIIGKPDFVFRKNKIVVFIDSEYWHGHPKRFVIPKTNSSYWKQKIIRNKKRDKKVNSVLKKEGWKVLRLWEYDIKKNIEKSIGKILRTIGR